MGKSAIRSREKRVDAPPARKEGLKPHLVICLLLILVTAGIYHQTLRHELINLDDNGYVFENARVIAGLSVDGVKYAFTSLDESNWHPLTWLSLETDASIARLVHAKLEAVIHLDNIVLHIACVLLLFAVLARMTGSVWKSAFVAAIFAIHPLHVESVAWAAERKDVLSTLFWLLTMLAYVWYAAQPKLGRYALVFALLAIGLLAKPMLVTLPVVLLLMDYWPLRRVQWTGKRKQGTGNREQSGSAGASPSLPHSAFRTPQSAVLEKLPLFALSIASSAMTCYAQKFTAMMSLDTFPPGVRVANAAYAAAGYLWKMIWPEKLSVMYPHLSNHIPPEEVIGGALVLLFITALAVLWRVRRPYLIVGWLWYLITLVPVIGLVQVGLQGMADRYTYVPLIGVFIMIAWGVPDLLGRHPAKSKSKVEREGVSYAPAVLAAACIVILVPVAYRQVSYWQNTTTLYTNVVRIFPRYAEGHMQIGQEAEAKGRTDQAMTEYELALEYNPHLAEAHMNLGKIAGERKDWEPAAEHYSQYVRMRPNNVPGRCSLGDVFLQKGDYEASLREFTEAARIGPDYAKAHYGQGAALMSLARQAEAEVCFAKAVALKPDYGDAHAGLAFVHCLKRDHAGAWREVRLSRKYGVEPNTDMLAVLSREMAEPPQ